jgi:hypothetical protein
MLAKARALVERHPWHNVRLLAQDAAEIVLPSPVDGVLFSLSYSVMPRPQRALAKAWEYLRPTRYVVIMDGKIARGLLGRLSRPLIELISKTTVLGNPDRQPWRDLRQLTPLVEVEEVNWGTYYICRGTKV